MSACVNDNVVDPVEAWQHNSFKLANNPEILWKLVEEKKADLKGAALFFYTAYERELESDGWNFDSTTWRLRSPDPSAIVPDDVSVPDDSATLKLLGYDVVVFDYNLIHSPLSCNSVAAKIPVNEHCLFDTFGDAKSAIDTGLFGGGCEEGDYSIFSVHLVADTDAYLPR